MRHLARMMRDIAGEHGLFALRANENGEMAGAMAGLNTGQTVGPASPSSGMALGGAGVAPDFLTGIWRKLFG